MLSPLLKSTACVAFFCATLSVIPYQSAVAALTENAEQAEDAKQDPNQPVPPKKFLVRVVNSQQRMLAGLPVQAWRSILDGSAWQKIKQEVKFDGGSCYLNLEEGVYRFETLAVLRNGDLFCARTKEISVDQPGMTIPMPPVTKQRVVLKDRGRIMPVSQLAISSIGNSEARWKSHSGAKHKTIYASSGDLLELNLIGGNQNLVVAAWQRFPAHKMMTISTSSKWFETTFRIDKDTPRVKTSRVELLYPTTKLEVLPDGPFQLVTNRRIVRMKYGLILKTGQQLVTKESLVDLEETPVVNLGGLLAVDAWATVISKDNGEKRLRWEATLIDGERREVLMKDSKLSWKSTIRFNDGKEKPKNPLTDDTRKLVGKPEQTMQVMASWNWGGQQEYSEPPSPLAEYRSEHFVLCAPQSWYNRARGYLGVLERSFEACQKRTGRNGPKQIDIRWRANTHNAKARVGGRYSWMSMPFRGLERATDPFRKPWFMVHEMIHTFGYHHGPKMTQLIDESGKLIGQAKWLPLDQEDHLGTTVKLSKKKVEGDDVPVESGESSE